LTIVIITHDLDLLWQSCDRVAVLGEGRVLASGSMEELSLHDHPIVRGYFEGPRQQRAAVSATQVRRDKGAPWTTR
jgi:phospholipid/cholesterol/gamma-HCH transport system ATP-binding protein